MIVSMHYNGQSTEFKYLIASERDRKFGLWCSTVGFQTIQPGSLYPPKEHPDSYYFSPRNGRILHEYQLVYITKGSGEFESESTQRTVVTEGNLLILFPGQWHNYSPSSKTGWNEYYIGFEGPIADRLFQNGFLLQNEQILNVGINENFVSLFVEALNAAEADKSCLQQYISGILLHLIGQLLSIVQNRRYETDNLAEKIERAKVFMYENLEKEIDLNELSLKLNVSYSWFRKFFKEYTGYAPAKYFQEMKIRKAKQLLLETFLPIKEISYRLNYQTPDYFFAVFKKSTSMTPTEYRNLGRQEIDTK